MTPAPLHADVASGPAGGRAFFVTAADGVRLRVAHWPATTTARGTVLLLPGRSEYAEKYGPTAAALAERGYHSLVLDWRGQGLSQRLTRDPMLGHVGDFSEYLLDVRALVSLAAARSLPRPLHLMSHSMGGAIALRALAEGLEVRTSVFSAPMWGIQIIPSLRPVAVTLSKFAHGAGQGHRYTPSTSRHSYVAQAGFRGNLLTRDPEIFTWMKAQIATHPELALGGPSLSWLHAALSECQRLATLPSPAIPAICALGTSERIIDREPIHARMARWPGGRLDLYAGAEHEVIMETPDHRTRFHSTACDLFDAHA